MARIILGRRAYMAKNKGNVLQASKWFQRFKFLSGFCSFGLGLIFNMMAYYHFLIKQLSCSFNQDRKQVLENYVWLTFPHIYQ